MDSPSESEAQHSPLRAFARRFDECTIVRWDDPKVVDHLPGDATRERALRYAQQFEMGVVTGVPLCPHVLVPQLLVDELSGQGSLGDSETQLLEHLAGGPGPSCEFQQLDEAVLWVSSAQITAPRLTWSPPFQEPAVAAVTSAGHQSVDGNLGPRSPLNCGVDFTLLSVSPASFDTWFHSGVFAIEARASTALGQHEAAMLQNAWDRAEANAQNNS